MANTSSTKGKRTSLKRRLVILVGLVILVMNTAQVLIISANSKKKILLEDTDVYTNMIKGYSLSVQNHLEGYFKELNTYLYADEVENGDLEEVFSWLQQPDHDDMRDEFDYILIAAPDGSARTDIGTETEISSRDYFQAVMKNGKDDFVDNPVISKTTGEPVIHITRALKDRNGKTFAMIAGVVTVNHLMDEINEIKIGEGGYAYLLSGEGLVMAHPQKELVMKKNFITDATNGDENLAIAKEMVAGKSGTGWKNSNTHKGKDFIVYTPITGTPWSLALTIPDNQIYDLIKQIQGMLLYFGIASIVILIGLTAFLLVTSLRPLNTVESAIVGIASGDADLTKRIAVKSNNEIGQVVKGFNDFTQKLQTIIGDVKESKDDLLIAGENLSGATEDTASSITEIIANIDSMKRQIDTQSQSVAQTAGAVNEIASNIESLEHMIESQSAGVTQASAAVEQMIGNISSVNNSVDKMASSFNDLRSSSQVGISTQNSVNERIRLIESQSQMLQEANVAISAIASQTNLLAMNAAIEAAHAGEAGKGFSVVADEIRKLSETSAEQSKTIGDQLNNIRESISEVVSASGESSLAFESVSYKLEETDALVMQIKAAMEEQNEGSKQITEALHSMNDSTVEVRNASSEMQEGNKMILQEVQSLQNASLAMGQSMEEMSVGARKINETGVALSDVAEQMKHSIQKIGTQVDKFKV
ncbi:MAG: HAMP domain-containing protein [Treponema sp.]|nr:HAMP domain-containing protein [Treponema sp.]